jgi:branched-chain amino acid aminotransferase
MLRHGKLVSPAPSDNILEGITLSTTLGLAKTHLGLDVERRSIDRTELYIADELFMTGTAAHVTPITEVDRVAVGDGKPGRVSKQIQDLYFQMITGRMPQYLDWLTPVFKDAAVAAKA